MFGSYSVPQAVERRKGGGIGKVRLCKEKNRPGEGIEGKLRQKEVERLIEGKKRETIARVFSIRVAFWSLREINRGGMGRDYVDVEG